MIIFERWLWNFMGIIIESLPFMLIGAIVSAIIQVYISENIIKKIIPKNRIVGFIGAALSGIIFPVCECAIVPITRSLIKKGLPLGIGVTFMLAVPIVNPVVIMSTYYAFPNNLNIVIIRTLGGITVALIVGTIIELIYSKKRNELVLKDSVKRESCDCCNVEFNFYEGKITKIRKLLNHASSEFLNISIYFTIGAFLSSIFATFINNQELSKYTFGDGVSVLIMMLLSFILSLCSEADAFVAKGFINNFGTVATLAFLILGPMMDLKNSILTLGLFKKKFTITLIGMIIMVISLLALTLIALGI